MSAISKDPMDTEMTPEEIEAFSKLSTGVEMSDFRANWLVSHGYAIRDDYRRDILHEVQKVVEPVTPPSQGSLTVEGMKFTGSEEQIAAQLKAFFEAKQAQQHLQTQEVPPARDPNTGRFARQDPQSSTTSAADRVINDQVAKAIEERTGVSLDEVKQLVEERRDQTFMQSWGQATEAYLHSEEGRLWPGGEENKMRLGKLIEKNTLPDGTPYVDAPDKVEILRACVEYMRDHDMIVPNPEFEAAKASAAAAAKAKADKAALETAIANAKTPEEIDALTGKTARAQARLRQGGGGNFGY